MLRSGVEFAPVAPGDIEHIAATVRPEDAVEVYEASRQDVATALKRSVRMSQRNATIRIDDEPVAMFGVGRLSAVSDVGVPWMLGTRGVTTNARKLLPYGPDVVRKMMQGHASLRNIVHDGNKSSIRWLKSLGFRLYGPEPLGWRGAMFHVFEMQKDDMRV